MKFTQLLRDLPIDQLVDAQGATLRLRRLLGLRSAGAYLLGIFSWVFGLACLGVGCCALNLCIHVPSDAPALHAFAAFLCGLGLWGAVAASGLPAKILNRTEPAQRRLDWEITQISQILEERSWERSALDEARSLARIAGPAGLRAASRRI